MFDLPLGVIAFRTSVLAWGLGLLSGVLGSVPLLLLALALCVVSLGAFVAGWTVPE